MDLDFTRVTYDSDLDDLSEEQKDEIIENFEDAQESNASEFEKAAEAAEGIDAAAVAEFEDARGDLIESITEAEAFSKVPLSEDKLEDESFSELQEWEEFVSEFSTESEESGSEEADFDDMGKRSPVPSSEEDEEFADEQLSTMQGINL